MKLNKKLGQYDIKNKLLGNMEFLLELKKEGRPFPFSISIYPSNVCNHRCNFCQGNVYLKENNQIMKTEIVKKLLYDLKKNGAKSITWSGGGEPLLHKDFYKMLKLSHSLGMVNGLITNFSIIDYKKIGFLVDNLVWLRISFNGGDKETYCKVHGVDHYETVIKNLKVLCEENKKRGNKLQISFSMVYKKDNINSMINLIKTAASLNINSVHVRPDQFIEDMNWLKSNEVKNIIKKVTELPKELDSNIQITTSEYLEKQFIETYPEKCYAHFICLEILANGDVSFCRSKFNDQDTHIGNIYESSIEEIWNNEKVKKLEKEIKPYNCIGTCRQMHLNMYTDSLINIPTELNIEFI